VHAMKQNNNRAPVLILSIYPEEQYAIRALKAGAAGYLSKEAAPEKLVHAIQKVLQGRRYISTEVAEKMADQLNEAETYSLPHEHLSDREFDVFKLIASGKTVKEISDLLLLNATTISTYRARIMMKMHAHTNADLTRYAIENNILIQA
jgi:two-component system, NarL family, invasion response regulator UvrY